ncbi:MAG: hypothetical protein U9R21_02680 [Candidatus Thermoplasmatota archaeon]|nr:hypothetical protein [Candidatus Thermoplasmatota archaeon]
MKLFRKTMLIIVALAVIIAIVLLCSATIYEDGLVKYKVKGRVLDKETHEPIGGAEVMLLLRDPSVDNTEEINKMFDIYSVRWKHRPEEERTGISDKDGNYITEGERNYSLRYWSFLGIRNPSPVFKKAWLVIRARGFGKNIVELDTTDWQKGSKEIQAIEPVYLDRLK